jgi:dTDP-4-amino-4,6-dideoxygalactose transaminase
MNLNPELLDPLITKNTKAVLVVHFAGQSVDFDRILPIAQQHGLPVIEDAAHAHGSRWRGRGLGSIGIAAGFSFQGSKNMTAGEGGMITTNDEHIARLCESYYSLGREAGRPWYEFHRLGWNYRMSEFQAALLRAQLGRLHQQNARRMVNARILDERLSQIPGIVPVERLAGADAHSYHIYMFRYEKSAWDGLPRQKFIEAVRAEGIPVDFGYAFPLFENPLFLEKNFHANGWDSDPTDYRCYQATCPVSRRLCYDEAVWIPHSTLLGSADDMQDICKAVEKVREHRGRLM